MKLNLKSFALILLLIFVVVYLLSSNIQVWGARAKSQPNQPVVSSSGPIQIKLCLGAQCKGEQEKLQAEAVGIAQQYDDIHVANEQDRQNKQSFWDGISLSLIDTCNLILKGLKWFSVAVMVWCVLMLFAFGPAVAVLALIIWLTTPKIRKKGTIFTVSSLLMPRNLFIHDYFAPTTWLQLSPAGAKLIESTSPDHAMRASFAAAKAKDHIWIQIDSVFRPRVDAGRKANARVIAGHFKDEQRSMTRRRGQ